MTDDPGTAAELHLHPVDAGIDGDRREVGDVLADQQRAVHDQPVGQALRTEDLGFEGKLQTPRQAGPTGRTLDVGQQGADALDEGRIVVRQLVGQALRAEHQALDDGLPAELGKIAAPVGQGHQQGNAVAALADIDRRAPQRIHALRHLFRSCHRVGAGGVARGGAHDARVDAERPVDDARAVGQHGADIGRQRALPHMIERERLGDGQEGHAGAGDALEEVHVLGGAEPGVEAALLDHQAAIQHRTMDDEGEGPRQGLERRARDVGREPGRPPPAGGGEADRAAIRDPGAGSGLELADHPLDESSGDRVVGIEE